MAESPDIEALAAALATRQRPDLAAVARAARGAATATKAQEESSEGRHVATTARLDRIERALADIAAAQKPGKLETSAKDAAAKLLDAAGNQPKITAAVVLAIITLLSGGGVVSGFAGRAQAIYDAALGAALYTEAQDAPPTSQDGSTP